jgi:hypothetical protein
MTAGMKYGFQGPTWSIFFGSIIKNQRTKVLNLTAINIYGCACTNSGKTL